MLDSKLKFRQSNNEKISNNMTNNVFCSMIHNHYILITTLSTQLNRKKHYNKVTMTHEQHQQKTDSSLARWTKAREQDANPLIWGYGTWWWWKMLQCKNAHKINSMVRTLIWTERIKTQKAQASADRDIGGHLYWSQFSLVGKGRSRKRWTAFKSRWWNPLNN